MQNAKNRGTKRLARVYSSQPGGPSNEEPADYRIFRGVRTVCPSPVTGRSASFRLRFRFVRVVRVVCAGEAKLRGRMTRDVLIAGPPGC